jgi:hypothetical protein
MDELEQQLKRALARQDAPAWLEAKVLSATRRKEAPWPWWDWWFAPGRMRWATGALAVMTVVTGIAWQRERVAEERAGEEARAKLELALRITSAKLQIIEQRIQQNQ